MKNTSIYSRLCGIALLALAGSACSGVNSAAPVAPAAPKSSPPAATASASELMQQLRAQIGSASCDSAQQCSTVAVGHKACGGPETYLAWSSKASDPAKVRQLAESHAASRKRENRDGGMVSTCSAVMDPGATCSAGRCMTAGGKDAI
jgi:hypothetical protein